MPASFLPQSTFPNSKQKVPLSPCTKKVLVTMGVNNLFFIPARLICVAFLVLVGLAIPETFQLNSGDYDRVNNTVFIPLEQCEAPFINVDGNAIIFEANAQKCYPIKYLVNACAVSMILSMAAMLVFFLFDVLSRCDVGPVSKSAVLGMSFFMTFILVQTAAICWSLFKECEFREDYFLEQFEKVGSDVDTVLTNANKNLFFYSMILAYCCAGMLLMDALMNMCCSKSKKTQRQESPRNDAEKGKK